MKISIEDAGIFFIKFILLSLACLTMLGLLRVSFDFYLYLYEEVKYLDDQDYHQKKEEDLIRRYEIRNK
ncbi:hypothetical protein UFOVP1361_42 [uncultured Caudovirales phage]|uniref:Uncharacterized protein n=1 Tax=uncultured Caudovirales phage TaxID=2100421 RepID=A0A6J5RUY5_9CAUD|nr:hypothetical protein UFOVP1361_42 [uncultured Caudovirales phage]